MSVPAERSIGELEELMRDVAHQLNNALSIIVNYTSFVEDALQSALGKPEGNDWQAVLADVGEVAKAAEKATSLVQLLGPPQED